MARSRGLSGGEAGKDPCKTRGVLTKLVTQNLEKNRNDKIILDQSDYYACTITHYPKNIGKVKAGQGGGRLKAGRLLHGGRISSAAVVHDAAGRSSAARHQWQVIGWQELTAAAASVASFLFNAGRSSAALYDGGQDQSK